MTGDEHTVTKRYEGWPGALTLIGEALVDGRRALKRDARRAASILRGSAEPTGETCHLEGCTSDAIATFPNPERRRDELDVCRRHWIALHGAIKGIKAAILSVPAAALLGVVWYV